MDLHLNLLRQQQQYLLLLNQQRGLVNTRFKQGPLLGNIPPQQPLINPLNMQHKIASNLQNPLLKPKLVPKNMMPTNVNVAQLNPHTHPHHHHRQQPTQHPLHQHPHQTTTRLNAPQQHMPHHNAHHNHLISQHNKHHNHNNNSGNNNNNNNNNNHNQINHNNQHGNYFHAVAQHTQHHADAINNTNKLTNHHSNNNNHNINSHNNNTHNINHHLQNSNINSNNPRNPSAFHATTKISSSVNNNSSNKNASIKHTVTTVKPSTTPSANNNNHHNNNNNNHSTLFTQSSRYSKANVISAKIDATERFDVPKISSKNLNPPVPIVTEQTVATAKAPLKRPYVPDNDDKKINGVYKLLNGAITGKIRSPQNINSSTPYSENLKPPPISKTYFNDSEISDAFSSESESIRGNDFGSCKVRKNNYFDDNYALKLSDTDTTGKNSSYFDDDTLDGIENYKIAESTRKSVVYPHLSGKNVLRPSNTITNLNNTSLNKSSANKSLAKSQTSKLVNKFSNYNANYKENTPGIRRFGVVNEKNLNKININHSQNSTLDQIDSYRPSYITNAISGYNPNGYIRKFY